LFLGPPGSGKGTQAKLLAEKYGLAHVAPGDIFRQEIRAKSELGQLVEGILAKGDLVPDATTLKIIEKRLSSAEG
jgi:adenylate kinase